MTGLTIYTRQIKMVFHISLKTEGDEAIINAVAKASKEIDDQVEHNDLIASAKHQIEISRPILQKEFMLELIEGKHKGKNRAVIP